jgi:hypothetical protein
LPKLCQWKKIGWLEGGGGIIDISACEAKAKHNFNFGNSLACSLYAT